MRVLLYLLQKEFIQIFRNRFMLPIIFVVPVVQLVLLTYAADFEIDRVRLLVLDEDMSSASSALTYRLAACAQFEVDATSGGFPAGMRALDRDRSDLFLRVPAGFEEALRRGEPAALMLDVNAIDGQAASISYFYALNIIGDFQADWSARQQAGSAVFGPPLRAAPRFWYNEQMRYANLMVPGLLVVLVTMLGMFLSAMNIVREKEIGTLEQLNVTPISRSQFIFGKLFPFWLIGMFELAMGLVLGRLIFAIPMVGSIPLLFAFAAIYLPVMLGAGLLISTVSNTQQQAMFLSWFFMVIFILMGGLFTPIENMPQWAQAMTRANPVAYFVDVVRKVLLKGSGFSDVKQHFAIVGAFAIGINVLAVRSYRKRL